MTTRTLGPAARWGLRLLLLGLSCLFALVLAEAGVRAWFWTKGIGRGDVREVLERSRRTDLPQLHGGTGLFGRTEPSPYPDIVYQLKPRLRGTLRGALLETNRLGLRGPEIAIEKPARTVRIVGLGDSHMFGWAVAQGEEYLRRLESQLNEHAADGWKFEVLNFGTPGYNTVMEVATFEHRALALEPDVVLLHFVGNDLDVPHFLRPPPGLAPSHWYVVELLRGFAATAPAGTDELEGGDEEKPEDDADDEEKGRERDPRSAWVHLGGKQAFSGALQRLAELTRARDLPVLFFQLGVKSELRRLARDEATARRFRFLDVRPSFAALAAERGIRSGTEYKEAFVRNRHPSPLGHEAYARALFCELEEMGIPHLRPTPEECPRATALTSPAGGADRQPGNGGVAAPE